MKITKKQRGDMLRAHNKLQDVIRYIDDCRDMSLSHIRDLEEAICILHQVGNFQPKKNAEGSSMWWGAWVFAEDAEKQDD